MTIQSYSTPGSYTFTLPTSTGITIRIAGAAGGTGGTDGGPPGIVGGVGGRGRYGVFTLPDYTSGTFTFVVGGAGGNGGNSGTTAFNGGTAGSSATSAGGGGQEDSPSGSSGGGAGGGGASSVSLGGSLIAIAGGGGGGGGGTNGATSNTGGVRTDGENAGTFSASTTSPTSTPDATGSVTGTGGDGGGAGGGGGGYTAGARGTFPGNDGVHPAEGGFGGGSFYRSNVLTISSQSTYTVSLNGYIEIEYTKVTFNDPAVSVSKAGPYYSSGPISFGSLRSNFRAQVKRTTFGGSESFNSDTSAISASDLLRTTSALNTNPVVPNATENANITSTQSNWQISDFRNSIKFYYALLPSTDVVLNFDIDAQTWNSNLNKNVNKIMFIEGQCVSTSNSSAAASFNATAYNFIVKVSGYIYGERGPGGTPSALSGGNGGDALTMQSNNGNNIEVNVGSGARIWGGGGGGEAGGNGEPGSSGYCSGYDQAVNSRTNFLKCAESPSQGYECSIRGYSNSNAGWESCCKERRGCAEANWRIRCWNNYSTSAGQAGTGGDGGPGRGYSNQSGSTDGIGGTEGTKGGGCGSTPGTNGSDGYSGGDWGQDGGGTLGGTAGRAISGTNYSVSGTINSSTIKGAYAAS